MKTNVIKTNEWVSMVTGLRCAAREADELGQRRIPGSPVLSAYDDESGNETVSVELTKREWSVVRRYLRRNRLRLLRKNAVSVPTILPGY